MIEAALILAASLSTQPDWYCNAGLIPGQDAPHPALQINFALSEDTTFAALGTVHPLGQTHNFDWSGTWTLADGQLAMIGTTRGRTFGIAPAGELRAFAQLTQPDVMILTVSNDANPAHTLRCLTYPLE